MIRARRPGTFRRTATSSSTRRSKRFTGTSRPTATTMGSVDRTDPGVNRGSTPGATTLTWSARSPSMETISSLDDDDKVTIRLFR